MPLCTFCFHGEHELPKLESRCNCPCHGTPESVSPDMPWWYAAAMRHAAADVACRRNWQCACGSCRVARMAGWNPGKELGHES